MFVCSVVQFGCPDVFSGTLRAQWLNVLIGIVLAGIACQLSYSLFLVLLYKCPQLLPKGFVRVYRSVQGSGLA